MDIKKFKIKGFNIKNLKIKKKPFVIVCIVIAVLIIAGIVIKMTGKKQAQPMLPEVSVIKIQTEEVLLITELPGRTTSYRVAEIRPQVSGILLKRLFTEGSKVNAGQVLYQIDPEPFKAALDNAKASLTKAEANLPSIKTRFERYGQLVKVNAISKQEYDDIKSQYEQAQADIDYWKAQVRIAQINLGYTRITAPITGIIGRSNITEGALVTAYQQMELTRIQQLDPIYVDIPQSTTELALLKRRLEEGRIKYAGEDQEKIKLILEDGSIYSLEGLLQFRDVTVDPSTGTVILRAIFRNPEGTLLPGMFVRAQIKEGVNKNAILLPQECVLRDSKGNPYVYIVDRQSKVQVRPIVIDRAIGNKWLVSSGLSEGELVIIEGLQKIRPDISVKAVYYAPKKTENRGNQ
ncbi:efflux RND transporter periplasmic adaptor subunit [Thermodesulfovibrio thiophilus]|uniref:efflux RND transporter periplasmic adaptor subunit n=1 Tax=Thermodesulfovibrio thiophilus TaxID=340095 RepID=UPI00040BF366|nr:efflux RND transporter periplasmic adaptor subunit [Thermodesulfovibrio thiophilus]